MTEYKVNPAYTVFEGANGFTVLKVRTTVEHADLAEGSTFVATGYNLPTQTSSEVVLEGEWETGGKYGKSFKVRLFTVAPPKNKAGFVGYMSTLHVGIGPKTATAIFDKFGESSWDICVNEPQKLLPVRGITQNVLDKLADGIARTQIVRDIMSEYRDCAEMTPERAALIYKKWDAEALSIIKANPYALCDIHGFSFATADALAKAGEHWCEASEERLLAGVKLMFQFQGMNGHTCVPKTLAIETLQRLLAISADNARKGLNLAYRRGECVVRGDFCYSAESYLCERALAAYALKLMRNGTAAIEVDNKKLEELIADFEKENGFQLADSQKDAVRGCFNTGISIITGGPGTGKSTIIKAILHCINAVKENAEVALMAPTGRAARRMTEATGHPASTIHSALGIQFDANEAEMMSDEPLLADMVIVDEFSMVDQWLARSLFTRIGDKTAVVLVGDSDQLPSVNAGNVLHELITSGLIRTTRLNVIFRQADGNPIITNSKKVLEGDTELMETKSFQLKSSADNNKVFSYACSFYERCVKQFGTDDVVMLVPFKKKGTICVNTLNSELQDRINPAKPGTMTLTIGKNEFRVGDKVMQTRNTNGPKNGDLGYIKAIEERPDPIEPWRKDVFTDILFEGEDTVVSYSRKDMTQIDLAYAQSIHKAQGSEYRVVIVLMTDEHKPMAKRNLLYTAITRAKEYIALIGNCTAFQYAIKNETVDIRYTQLSCILQELHAKVPVSEDPRYYTG